MIRMLKVPDARLEATRHGNDMAGLIGTLRSQLKLIAARFISIMADVDLTRSPTAYEWLIENSFSMVQLRQFCVELNLRFPSRFMKKKQYVVKALFAAGAGEHLLKKLDEARPGVLSEMAARTTPVLYNQESSFHGHGLPPNMRGRPPITRAQQHDTEYDHYPSRFLDIPTQQQLQDIYADFYRATSSAAVALATCAVCGKERMKVEIGIHQVPLTLLPHSERLVPKERHEKQILTHGLLLARKACVISGPRAEDVQVAVCDSCYSELDSPRPDPPKLSLANGLWYGEVPWQLRCLTFPEQLLISRLYPRVFIIKLYPKDGRPHNPETLQSALKGNVTSFELNLDKVADMINGNLMPQLPRVLASILSITYVGRGHLSKNWLKATFRVRRYHVAEALKWLKENNPKLYGDIVIDDERLRRLPEDDVPEEIWSFVRHEPEEQVIELERAGYMNSEDPQLRSEGPSKSKSQCIE